VTYRFDAIVLGAGAAGLMCAAMAGRRGRRVAVLERSARAGQKILISGGGRCNFTNRNCRAENYLSKNPHFAKSALARYGPAEFLALLERHRIPYHEKTLGQLFCDRSAQDLLALLEGECAAAGVQIVTRVAIDEVGHGAEFTVRAGEREFAAPALVVATGGLSLPKLGATGFGHELARRFGLAVCPTRPALVPLVFGDEDRRRYCDLAGVPTEVVAGIGKRQFREKLLVTHQGLSGPAILQISSYWLPGQAITLDLAPDRDVTAPLRAAGTARNGGAARAALRAVLPRRLADRWLELHPPANWSTTSLAAFERQLHQWQVTPARTEGYAKAEVTAGGVDTSELSAKTMESRQVRGLFFIGEVVDVTGQLGGFNLQWAWASGACASEAL
jgi:hypothetical protein